MLTDQLGNGLRNLEFTFGICAHCPTHIYNRWSSGKHEEESSSYFVLFQSDIVRETMACYLICKKRLTMWLHNLQSRCCHHLPACLRAACRLRKALRV